MTIKINSENLNVKRRVALKRAESVAAKALRALKKKSGRVNIVFVSNQKIRALNRKYRGKDISTDVLAFPPGRRPGEVFSGEDRSFLGDIAISSDKASENARIYGGSYTEEIALYVIHGVLHLLGYDDTTAAGRRRMQRKEDELLQEIRRHS